MLELVDRFVLPDSPRRDARPAGRAEERSSPGRQPAPRGWAGASEPGLDELDDEDALDLDAEAPRRAR
jgi:hypothetical protein